MIIYAAYDGAIIWSDNNQNHKAGRVPLHEPLTVIREYAQNWFVIERPENLSLAENPKYPEYWVYRTEIIETLPDPDPKPDPEPNEITDVEAANAILIVLKWWKQE